MRKLKTSNITASAEFPVKEGTLQHMQLAYQEALNALALNVVGRNANQAVGYILYGCVNSGSSGSMNVSAGAIYYNGEVFLVDAFTLAVSNTAVGSIATTYFSTNADPVTFTNGISYNVHEIRKIVFTNGASGSGIFDFNDLLTTPLILRRNNQVALGSSYTVKFDQDLAVFFDSATVNSTFTFDFTNAVPGAVVRMKWVFGAGKTLTINQPAGSLIIKESGDLANVASNTNIIYFLYIGVNGNGNHEVSYTLKQV